MRFSLFALLPFAGFLATGLASPVSGTAVEKRQDSTDSAITIIESLYATVQTYTGAINSTAASLNADSSAADNATAALAFQSAVESITAAINDANTQVVALEADPAAKRSLQARQDDAASLATLVEDLILDISGALNNIIATLGLTSLLGSLTPLVSSLSGLLASLEVVVNNLLALVQALLDGLLTGLSVGLAGLTL